MMRLIKWVVLTWCCLILITSAVIVIGRGQPMSDGLALMHLDECEMPCWIGIAPGKTSWLEAENLIHQIYNSDNGFEISIFTSDWGGTPSAGEVQSLSITNKQQSFSFGVDLRYVGTSSNMKPINDILFSFHDISLGSMLYERVRPDTVLFYRCCYARNNTAVLLDASRQIEVMAYMDNRFTLQSKVIRLVFYDREQRYEEVAGGLDIRKWKGFACLSTYNLIY